MSIALIVIIVLVVLFGVMPLLLRSNAVLIFFALCAGELLARLTAQDATQFLRSLPATNNLPLYSIVQIALLLLPPIFILFGYRNSSKAGQLFFMILPAVASVIVGIMLIVAKLPYETKATVEASSLYTTISPYFSVAIAAGLVSSTLYLIATAPNPHKRKKHKNSLTD